MQAAEINQYSIDSFIFVVISLVIYFSFFSILYFAEVGIDAISYWKILATLSLWTLGIAIVSFASNGILYQSLPTILGIITFDIFFLYLFQEKKRRDTLNFFAIIVCTVLFIIVLFLAILRSVHIILFDFDGSEIFGLDTGGRGVSFNIIVHFLLSSRAYVFTDFIFLISLVFFVIFNFLLYFHGNLASYTFLQERPSSVPYLVTAINLIQAIIYFILNIHLLLNGFIILGLFISIYISWENFQRSNDEIYSFFFSLKFLLALITIIFILTEQNIYLLVTISIILLLADFIYIPGK
jgi:hypothetical protein